MPGCAPGGAVSFFCSATGSPAERKTPKKRRPHLPCPCASLRATCGARSMGGAAELTMFAPLTSFKQLQRVRSRSKGILQCPCPPIALRSSARPEGQGNLTRAIASLGPVCAGASASRCAIQAERSDGPYGCWAVGLLGCWAVGLPPPFCMRLGRAGGGVAWVCRRTHPRFVN